MPRPTMRENIKEGFLSLPNAEELSGISSHRIKVCIRKGLIKAFQVPQDGTRVEYRIDYQDFLSFIEKYKQGTINE